VSEIDHSRWRRAPEELELAEGGLDVWRLRLEQSDELVDACREHLPDAEIERAERFRFERDRRCYLVTRTTLRLLLSAYLAELGIEVSPSQIRLETSEHGKPRLADQHNPSQTPLEFNVSHSGELSLLAFCRGRRVGVDIERVCSTRRQLDNVARFFAERECARLDDLRGDERVDAFFRCWTRKEAFIKATGRGFGTALDSFAVSVGPEAKLLWLEDGDSGRWQMSEIDVDAGYIAAVCAEASQPLYLRTMTATVSNSSSVQLDL
jgi:4'-phosphopantetheinyl transferase